MLHPLSYRLSINKFWLSTWNSYSLKNYRNLILNDKILKVLGIIFTNCFKMNYPVPSTWSNTRKLFRKPFMKAIKKAKNIGFDGRVSIQIGPYKLKKIADFILPENYKIIRFSNFSILKICFLMDDNADFSIYRHKKVRSPLTHLDFYYSRKTKKKNSPLFRRKLSKFLIEKQNFKSTGYFIYITNLLKNKHIKHTYYSELIYVDRNKIKADRKKKKQQQEMEKNINNIFRELIVNYITNNSLVSNLTINSIIDKWLKKIGQEESIKYKDIIKRSIKTNTKNKSLELNFIEGTELKVEIDKFFIPYLKDRMSKRLKMDFVGMRFEESKEMVRELDYIEEEEKVNNKKFNFDSKKKHWNKNIIVTLLTTDEQNERNLMLKKIKFKKNLADLEEYFGNNIKEDRIKARKKKKKSYISKFNKKENNRRLIIFNFYYNNFNLINKVRNNYFLFYFKDMKNNNNLLNNKIIFYNNNNVTKSLINFSSFSKISYNNLNNIKNINTNKLFFNFKKTLSKKSRIKKKHLYLLNNYSNKYENKFLYSNKLNNNFNLIQQNFSKIKSFNTINKLSYYSNINFLFNNFLKSFKISPSSKLVINNNRYLKSILLLNIYKNNRIKFNKLKSKFSFKTKSFKNIFNGINLLNTQSYLSYLSNRYKNKNIWKTFLFKKANKMFNLKIININSNLKILFLKKLKKTKNIHYLKTHNKLSKWYHINIEMRRLLQFHNMIELKTLFHSKDLSKKKKKTFFNLRYHKLILNKRKKYKVKKKLKLRKINSNLLNKFFNLNESRLQKKLKKNNKNLIKIKDLSLLPRLKKTKKKHKNLKLLITLSNKKLNLILNKRVLNSKFKNNVKLKRINILKKKYKKVKKKKIFFNNKLIIKKKQLLNYNLISNNIKFKCNSLIFKSFLLLNTKLTKDKNNFRSSLLNYNKNKFYLNRAPYKKFIYIYNRNKKNNFFLDLKKKFNLYSKKVNFFFNSNNKKLYNLYKLHKKRIFYVLINKDFYIYNKKKNFVYPTRFNAFNKKKNFVYPKKRFNVFNKKKNFVYPKKRFNAFNKKKNFVYQKKRFNVFNKKKNFVYSKNFFNTSKKKKKSSYLKNFNYLFKINRKSSYFKKKWYEYDKQALKNFYMKINFKKLINFIVLNKNKLFKRASFKKTRKSFAVYKRYKRLLKYKKKKSVIKLFFNTKKQPLDKKSKKKKIREKMIKVNVLSKFKHKITNFNPFLFLLKKSFLKCKYKWKFKRKLTRKENKQPLTLKQKLKEKYKFREKKIITYWAFNNFNQNKQNYWKKKYYIDFCKKPIKFIPSYIFNKYSWLKKKKIKQRYFIIFDKEQHQLNKSVDFKVWWPNKAIKDAIYNRSHKIPFKYLFWSKRELFKKTISSRLNNIIINNFLKDKKLNWNKKFYLKVVNKKFNKFFIKKSNWFINYLNYSNKFKSFLYNSYKNLFFNKRLVFNSKLNLNKYLNKFKSKNPSLTYNNRSKNKVLFYKSTLNFNNKLLLKLFNFNKYHLNNNLLLKFNYSTRLKKNIKKNIKNILKLFKNYNNISNINIRNNNKLLLNTFNLTNRLSLDKKNNINNKIHYINNIFKINSKVKLIKKIKFKNIGFINYNNLYSKLLYNNNYYKLNIDNNNSFYKSNIFSSNYYIKKINYIKKHYLLPLKKDLIKKNLYKTFWKNKIFSSINKKRKNLIRKKNWFKYLINSNLNNYLNFFTLTRPVLLKSNRKNKIRLKYDKYAFKGFSSKINFKIRNKYIFYNNIDINYFKKLNFFNSRFGNRSTYFQVCKFKNKGLNNFTIKNNNYKNFIFQHYYKNNFLNNLISRKITTNFLIFNKIFYNSDKFYNNNKKAIYKSYILNINNKYNSTFDFKYFLNIRRKRSQTKKKTVNEVINWYYFWWYVDSAQDFWKIENKTQSFRFLPIGPWSLTNYSRYLSYKKFILPKVYSRINKPLVRNYYNKLALKKKNLNYLYKKSYIDDLLNISSDYWYKSFLRNKKFKSVSFFYNTGEFFINVVAGTAKNWLAYQKKLAKLEKKKSVEQKQKEKELKKKNFYIYNLLKKRRIFSEKLLILDKKFQYIIFKKPYDPYNIKEERRLALKKKNHPKLMNNIDTDKNILLLPPLRYKFKNFSPILTNSKILHYNKFLFQKNIDTNLYLTNSKFYSKFYKYSKQIITNYNLNKSNNLFKYKISKGFYFLKNKLIKSEYIYFKNGINSNLLLNNKSFLFSIFFKNRIKKKRKFINKSKNLLFNKFIPFIIKNFFHSTKNLINLGLWKFTQYKRHYKRYLNYRSYAILKELEIKRKMRLRYKFRRTKILYSRWFLYWKHLKWFNLNIKKNIDSRSFKYYDLYYSFKSYEKFKKLNFYYLLSLNKKASLNKKVRSNYNNVVYLNEFLKIKFKKLNYYMSYFNSKTSFLSNSNLPINLKLIKNWSHLIKFSSNISKRIRFITHLKYRVIKERLYLWRINKRKVKKLTKFYKEKRRLYITYLKDKSVEPYIKSQISFHLNIMKRRFIKFKHFHTSPLRDLVKHVKKKIQVMNKSMHMWLIWKIPSKKWKILKNISTLHGKNWLWYKKNGFCVDNSKRFSKYYLVRKLFKSTRIKNTYEDPIILVKKFIEYLFFILFKFSNLRLFYKKVYRINAMGQKARLFKNLFNYRLATGFKVPFLVKIIYQKLSYDKQLIGCKIGFFGRYSKKLRNRKIWRYVRYLKPSNINTPLDYYNIVILQKWGITGFKLTMLRKKTVDLLFLNKF